MDMFQKFIGNRQVLSVCTSETNLKTKIINSSIFLNNGFINDIKTSLILNGLGNPNAYTKRILICFIKIKCYILSDETENK